MIRSPAKLARMAIFSSTISASSPYPTAKPNLPLPGPALPAETDIVLIKEIVLSVMPTVPLIPSKEPPKFAVHVSMAISYFPANASRLSPDVSTLALSVQAVLLPSLSMRLLTLASSSDVLATRWLAVLPANHLSLYPIIPVLSATVINTTEIAVLFVPVDTPFPTVSA
jgi:hypothetical protein